jgi:hypothetical protein
LDCEIQIEVNHFKGSVEDFSKEPTCELASHHVFHDLGGLCVAKDHTILFCFEFDGLLAAELKEDVFFVILRSARELIKDVFVQFAIVEGEYKSGSKGSFETCDIETGDFFDLEVDVAGEVVDGSGAALNLNFLYEDIVGVK